jgi:dethiobiotin synthetase
MRAVVVTGTDTGVGKTVITAALAALLQAGGRRVAVVKPVQTGVADGAVGDLDDVRRLAGVDDLHEYARFPEPLAPATAARRARSLAPSVDAVAESVRDLTDRDLVLIEGAGGLLVRLDEGGGTVADLAAMLGAPAVVVTRAGLGTLNATALTCEALRARRVKCLGTVIGSWPAEPQLADRCNVQDLPAYTGVSLLGWLGAGAASLDPRAFLEAAKTGLTALRCAVEALLLAESEARYSL